MLRGSRRMRCPDRPHLEPGRPGNSQLQRGRSLEVPSPHLSVPVCLEQAAGGSRSDEVWTPSPEGRGDAAVQHTMKAEPIATSGGELR